MRPLSTSWAEGKGTNLNCQIPKTQIWHCHVQIIRLSEIGRYTYGIIIGPNFFCEPEFQIGLHYRAFQDYLRLLRLQAENYRFILFKYITMIDGDEISLGPV